MEQYSQENPLFELLYILRGGIPQQQFLFHHIFRYFDKDQKLAIKLCRKLMNYQDCNQKNPNGQTPLQIAIIYNQKGAIRYAQHDSRFDFNDDNLMQLAITNSNFEIVEILLIDEGLSVIESNSKKMNSQSSTNLKILKRYEKIEIQRVLRDDTSEYQETIINEIPQFLLAKTPGKIMIENINESLIPTTQCIQTSENISQEGISEIKMKQAKLCSQSSCQENQILKQENEIRKQQENRIPFQNLFRCQTYVEQLLSTIFQFKYPQLDCAMLLFLQQNKVDCYYKNLDGLIELMSIPPLLNQKQYSSFDQTNMIDNYCKQFCREITQKLYDYKSSLKKKQYNFDALKAQLSSKLKYDISYQGPSMELLFKFQNLLQIYRSLFYILHKPYLNANCTFFILEQFELINKVEMFLHFQLLTTNQTIQTNHQ
ncbi:unnamed protein product [Paramecium sonneborni]|uniref:Ankyrin repeat-containing domain n=1 Tax=Paramecium sonneborni TaxID=65129 RepID=A0A8S1NNV3_9CILI|nr:unnamed protein product [Paramecium sonneborni]